MSDPLDDFLGRDFSCEPSDALRQTLRERTTRVLRLRRRLKKLALGGALAACFLAGMVTTYFLGPHLPAAAEQATQPPPGAEHKAAPTPLAQLPRTAQAIEWLALDQPDERSARLRLAGDLYLKEEQDYAGALRCYTQALNTGDAQATEFSPDDTWLEMALKDARRKEKARAN
jgi:hypothetical protein